MYTGSKIKYKSLDSSAKAQKKVLDEELEAIILPKPNSSILGLRVKLWFYNIAGKPTGKGLRYFIKNKLGEPPVYTSSVNFEKNRAIMANRLENRGYFKGRVSVDTLIKKLRTQGLFTARPGVQYTIDTVNFPKDSSKLSTDLGRLLAVPLNQEGDLSGLLSELLEQCFDRHLLRHALSLLDPTSVCQPPHSR